MSKTQYYHIHSRTRLRQMDSLSQALSELKQGGFLWLNFCDPTKEQLSELVEPLGVHPLSIDDCLDDDQVPKIEDFPNNTFILFNTYGYKDRTLTVEEVDFILGDKFLITVHGHNGGHPHLVEKLEEAVRREMENAYRGPDFLMHVILDYIVDNKFASIEAIQDEIDGAEELIVSSPDEFNPKELLHLRRHLLALRKSLFHEREIMVKICRKDSPFIAEKSIYHFRDIYDHLTKFFEAIEINREMITSLMEMYLSIINIQMTRAANMTNKTVRRLTMITTIFMPLTLLAGIGGMSEWSMMTGPENWRLAYPLFMLGMAVVGIVSYFLLKWIESRSSRTESSSNNPHVTLAANPDPHR